MLIGVALGWQAAATVALLRPAIGWLRTLLASLVPLNPPEGGGREAIFGAEITSESVLSGLASPALEPRPPIDPEVSRLPEAGPAPALGPETDPDQRSFISRLAEPIVLQLRQIEFPGGDLLVATAAFLLVWRWLWRGVAA
jgi:hypothetical protein